MCWNFFTIVNTPSKEHKKAPQSSLLLSCGILSRENMVPCPLYIFLNSFVHQSKGYWVNKMNEKISGIHLKMWWLFLILIIYACLNLIFAVDWNVLFVSPPRWFQQFQHASFSIHGFKYTCYLMDIMHPLCYKDCHVNFLYICPSCP